MTSGLSDSFVEAVLPVEPPEEKRREINPDQHDEKQPAAMHAVSKPQSPPQGKTTKHT